MFSSVLSQSRLAEKISQQNQPNSYQWQYQAMLYQFLLEIVKNRKPAEVLLEFKRLFIDYESSPTNLVPIQELSELVSSNNQEEYLHILKRSCYILINNWETTRNHNAIKELDKLLSEAKNSQTLESPERDSNPHIYLLNKFLNSQDYDELKLFISAKYDLSPATQKAHWSNRYSSYLLAPQYTNDNNPVEQREATKVLAEQLKNRFKFELAMYTARSQSTTNKQEIPNNPTSLGDQVLRLIKMIVAKRGSYSYENLANIFLNQTRSMKYKDFKFALHKYLISSTNNYQVKKKDLLDFLQQKLANKLKCLYDEHNNELLNDALLLRSCNKVIDYLTIEDQQEPSELFVLLLSQGHPLSLVIVLLKIVMICPNARSHLDTCIAKLIQYYTNYPEEECKWVINFFEVFNITFAIHADNVKYNLIKMGSQIGNEASATPLDGYRVFSQLQEDVIAMEQED
ncbi:MAG: hypothetical protein F6K31_31225 [Symploca sp. SIO2G7]|nr:hypothetical protein [Symploca sp. SIO2G7]